MFTKHTRNILLAVLIMNLATFNASFAQSKPLPKPSSPPKVQPSVAAQTTQATKTKVTPSPSVQASPAEAVPSPQPEELQKTLEERKSQCPCAKPALDSIDKAYVAVEEYEWPAAIKECTNSLTTVKNLKKTCKCPDVADYENIAQAFLNYAKGGDHLDGQEDPDCVYVKKLYTDAIKLLDDTIPKLKDSKMKSNAENIKGYCKEELDFVNDECS